MSDEVVRVIVSVENATLRDALLSALLPLPCSPESLLPDVLLQTVLSGYNLIFLETNDDIERLISIAQQLWEKWGETHSAGLQFLSYSTPVVTPDSMITRLWSIGPEMTVIVQVWTPDEWAQLKQGVYAFTQRILEWQTAPE